jgi:hypothetical protein
MPHRELLTESQRLSLQAPASDERGMVRHYTLSLAKSYNVGMATISRLSKKRWEIPKVDSRRVVKRAVIEF